MAKRERKDYWGILGVAKETPLDEVKRIYRQLAGMYHPDKNPGDKEAEEKFKEISEAYEVISDPGKRVLYETTGYAERNPIDKEAESVLLQGFQDALNKDATDILRHVRAFVDGGKQQLLAQKNEIIQKQRKLEAKRKKVKLKKKKGKAQTGNTTGKNLFELVIEKEIENQAQNLNTVNYKLEVATACYKALDDYEEEKPLPPGYGIVLAGGPGTMGGVNIDDIIKQVLKPNRGGRGGKMRYLGDTSDDD